MVKRKRWFLLLAGAALGLCSCAVNGRPNKVATQSVAAGLACGELEQGGARRPFADGSNGVVMTELRVSDLASFDPEERDRRRQDPVGVRYSIPASLGTSQAWLERQVRCYRASRAASPAADPLLVASADVTVRTGVGRYVVDVSSDDPRVAREVLTAAGL